MDLWEELLSIIISVVFGIILGYFFLFKSVEKKIEYETESDELIPESLSEQLPQTTDFRILSGDDTVASLTSTIVTIENTGYNAIKRDEIPPAHPIRISVEGDNKIYYTQWIGAHGDDFGWTTENNSRIITFNYFNRGDGVKLRVFHSGKGDDLKVSGKIIGGTLTKKPKWKYENNRRINITFISFILAYLIFVIGGVLFFPPSYVTSVGSSLLIVFVLVGIMLILVIVIRKILLLIDDLLSKYLFKKVKWPIVK